MRTISAKRAVLRVIETALKNRPLENTKAYVAAVTAKGDSLQLTIRADGAWTGLTIRVGK